MPPRQPIPLAVVLTSFDIGGTERQMTELIRRLDPRRFTVHAVCLHRRGAWLARACERAASVEEFPIRGFGRPATLARIVQFARWCRARRIAVVQTCDLYANVFGLTGAFLAGVPVRIGSRRHVDAEMRRARRTLEALSYRLASRMVANSQAAARRLEALGVEAKRVSLIPSGIDAAVFLCERSEGRAKARRPRLDVAWNCGRPASAGPRRPRLDVAWNCGRPASAGPRLITVGNLRPEKGVEVLIDAMAILAKHITPVVPGLGRAPLELLIVGDGPLRSALERRAEARGVASVVRFLGARDDVPALLASADLFVFASRTEASPNAVLEAMAGGLPIVATGVGGIPELIEDGRTGRLVPPDGPAALAGAVADLLTHPDEARALGEAARRRVESQFSFDRMVEQFEILYLQELDSQAVVTSGSSRTVPESGIRAPES